MLLIPRPDEGLITPASLSMLFAAPLECMALIGRAIGRCVICNEVPSGTLLAGTASIVATGLYVV